VSDSAPVTAICPGSYDPVTNGHLDIITRAAGIFDRVVVGVVRDPQHKKAMFTVEERVQFLRDALAGHDNIEVESSPSSWSSLRAHGVRRRWSRAFARSQTSSGSSRCII